MAEKARKDAKVALSRIREVVDPERLSEDEELIEGYLEPGADSRNLLAVVRAGHPDEVRKTLEVARECSIAAYTPVPGGLNPRKTGVVLDLQDMDGVGTVDRESLFVGVEPGVTWESLLPELKRLKVRIALPAAAKTPFVLQSALDREVVQSACRFTNRQLSTFEALLADGRDYRSGADALPGSVSHWRQDGGPNISRIFTGSRNSFGVVTGAFIFLYPEPQARKVVVLGLPNRKAACTLAREAARLEPATEVVLMNRPKARDLLGADDGLATWTVSIGLEGTEGLVQYWQKRLDRLAQELRLRPKKGSQRAVRAFTKAFEVPWYAREYSLGFYTSFARIEELSQVVESALKAKGRLAQMVVPVNRGSSVYVHFDIQNEGKDAGAAIRRLLPRLADRGAFFPTPAGALAVHIFNKQPEYLRLLKEIKRFMDPGDILNPGQLVEV